MFGFDPGLNLHSNKKVISFVVLDILGLSVCISGVHLLETETIYMVSSSRRCSQMLCGDVHFSDKHLLSADVGRVVERKL